MARPRIFISSTFYNLKEVRAALEASVRQMGYDAVVTDNITYLPGQPLDESCYLEAGSCDILVLIVGGRYGSEVSATDRKDEKEFYDRYESITRREFESALERDVPIYVAVDRAVQIEYGTWDANRDNESVKYRHVDSVNVFGLIDFIRNQTQTPVHEFERSADILEWLREQWSGLFQKMLSERSEQRRLASLEAQVGELREVSATFKRYLETMLTSTDEVKAPEIIAEEEARLKNVRLGRLLRSSGLLSEGEKAVGFEEAVQVIAKASSIEDLAHRILEVNENSRTDLAGWFRMNPDRVDEINAIRKLLELPTLEFEQKKYDPLDRPVGI